MARIALKAYLVTTHYFYLCFSIPLHAQRFAVVIKCDTFQLDSRNSNDLVARRIPMGIWVKITGLNGFLEGLTLKKAIFHLPGSDRVSSELLCPPDLITNGTLDV